MMTLDNDDDDDDDDGGGDDHLDVIKKIRTTIRVGAPICLLAYLRPLDCFLSAGFYLLLPVISNIYIQYI